MIMALYLHERIKDLKIEMSHENGEDVTVVFVDPVKMRGLLEENPFLKALAEKLDKKEI